MDNNPWASVPRNCYANAAQILVVEDELIFIGGVVESSGLFEYSSQAVTISC